MRKQRKKNVVKVVDLQCIQLSDIKIRFQILDFRYQKSLKFEAAIVGRRDFTNI